MIIRALYILVFVASAASAQSFDGPDLITNPAISGRCKSLLQVRTQKIRMQQRLRSLLVRNEKTLKKVPAQKDSLRSRLEFTRTKIQNNIRLSKLKLQNLEEKIVRRGCPGVTL